MKIMVILICMVLFSSCWRDNEYSTSNKLTKKHPETDILTDQRAAIKHVDSIILHEDNSQYIGVVWNLVASGGFFFIPDWISRDIKVYDKTGKFQYTIGTMGEGPGEFRDVRGGMKVIGDTLYIIDIMLQRLNMFKTDGDFLYSFPLPSGLDYTGLSCELLVIGDAIVMPVYENKYVPMVEYHKSRTIALLDKQGNILHLFGKHPDEYSEYNMYMPSTSITLDNDGNIYQVSKASPVIHKYNTEGDLIARFGVVGKNFKPISFNYSPGMPIEEIERLGLQRSSSSSVYWLPSRHIIYGYHNITEESQSKRDPMFHERFLQVYTDDGIYIPSNILLPGVLLTVDENGLLYILTDHTPGNRIIDVYELHIEITDE